MPNYRFTSVQNRHVNWTESIVLEKDDAGNVTKELKLDGEPVELSEDEAKELRASLGVNLIKTDDDAPDQSAKPNAGESTSEPAAQSPVINPESANPQGRAGRKP